MATYPSSNPDLLAVHNGRQIITNDNALPKNPDQPLINRAINATFPPGSKFKIVTSSSFLSQDPTRNTQTASTRPPSTSSRTGTR